MTAPDPTPDLAAAMTRLREQAEVYERLDTGDGWMETPLEGARQMGADLRVVLGALEGPIAWDYAGARPGPVRNYETHADRALADRVVVDDGPRVQILAAFDPSVVVDEVEVIGYRDHPSFTVRLANGTDRSWPAALVREVPNGGEPS